MATVFICSWFSHRMAKFHFHVAAVFTWTIFT